MVRFDKRIKKINWVVYHTTFTYNLQSCLKSSLSNWPTQSVLIEIKKYTSQHHPLQKWVDFVAIQQRFADGNSVHEVLLRQLMWDPNIELFFESSLLQMVQNGWWLMFSFWAMLRLLTWRSISTFSMILSTFTTAGLPERGASFTSTTPERNRSNHCCATRTKRISALYTSQIFLVAFDAFFPFR